MTPDVSILLPTIRPERIVAACACLPAACAFVRAEVIIVADFEGDPGLPFVQWIYQPRAGVIAAIAAAAAVARAPYWFVFNDESRLEPGAIAWLHVAACRDPSAIYAPRHRPAFPFQYYGRPFAPFPFVARTVVERLGGLFDPIYRAFYADPDFSLRAHAAGVSIHDVPKAVIHHRQHHDASHRASVSAYLETDRATFRARWDHLGEFRDP